MIKRTLLAVVCAGTLASTACTTTGFDSGATLADQQSAIRANVGEALSRLYNEVPSANEIVSNASGVLVFPDVLSAGLVVGGSYGEGALLVDNQIAGYYRMTSAAAGLLAGAQNKSVYLAFMTDEALADFRNSQGWTVGANASVALLQASATADINSRTIQQPVVGWVLTNAGLMASLALDGTKFTKLDPA